MFSWIRGSVFKIPSSAAKYTSATPQVGILGAPFNKGQPKEGVEQTPNAIRKLGLIHQLTELGIDVKDYGNIKFNDVLDSNSTTDFPFGILRYPDTVADACHKVSEAVKNVLNDKRLCVTIGGDHSTGLGTVHGHSEVHDCCVLWVDAHVDINTPVTSLSGNMHGMPCSFFVEELQKYQCKLDGFEWVKPRIKKENIAWIGLRSIDPFEKLILKKEEIKHFTMSDIDKLGINEVTQQALEAINPGGKLSLHVSFDIDVISPLEAPSTGTPVHGGLTIREAVRFAEEISQLDYFRGLDIMEVNPSLGNAQDAEKTMQAGIMLIKAFLGHSWGGCCPIDTDQIPRPE